MSDLLPLVLTTIRDKAVVDAMDELEQLKKERDASSTIEVIRSNYLDKEEHSDMMIYASGLFSDGKYSYDVLGTSFQRDAYEGEIEEFQVDLKAHSTNTCLLSELRQCEIIVGGGFPICRFGYKDYDYQFVEGFIAAYRNHVAAHDHDANPNDEVDFQITFHVKPYETYLNCTIKGIPMAVWEHWLEENDIGPRRLEFESRNFPQASITFDQIAFGKKDIHGALKRLFPSNKRHEILSQREKEKVRVEFLHFLAVRILAHGENEEDEDMHEDEGTPLDITVPMDEIEVFLKEKNIISHSGNENFIQNVVNVYFTSGRAALDTLPVPRVLGQEEMVEE